MSLSVLRTSQIGHAVGVDLKLVTLEMLADERQQRVQDSDGPGHRGGGRVSVACRRETQREISLKMRH